MNCVNGFDALYNRLQFSIRNLRQISVCNFRWRLCVIGVTSLCVDGIKYPCLNYVIPPVNNVDALHKWRLFPLSNLSHISVHKRRQPMPHWRCRTWVTGVKSPWGTDVNSFVTVVTGGQSLGLIFKFMCVTGEKFPWVIDVRPVPYRRWCRDVTCVKFQCVT